MALTRPTFYQLTTAITSFTDPITVLHQGASSANVDVGFLFNRANGLVSNVALYWSESAQALVTAYTANTGVTNTNVTATSYANITTGNITSQNVNGTTAYFSGNVGIGTSTPSYKLQVSGSFAATTKSFVIDHPTKPGMTLRYGSLEGPENGVYVRGMLTGTDAIDLPDYWTKLVDPNSITVQLTPIDQHQQLYVKEIKDNKILIGNNNLLRRAIKCFYIVYGERCDVDKLLVEIG